ncbi:hypothetical protein like AT5G56960 [Hibiscus trionum]|uniref:BHLH domain-containing protein n=1 Tax=Hibiscus trionum TaxID=183268 RepID=A0A9W7MJT6_HIBTR|nr:hypothetical protein like AT5G56960 [Hibiscus trionum]
MDAVFQLDDVARAEYLQLLMQSVGCTYICLWSYSNQANSCLIGFDGCYAQENTQPVAFGLFVQYRQSVFPLGNDHSLVPGFAFLNNLPYIELGEPQLQTRASDQTQQQFYQEAGIKRAVFMGCRSGEIELGSSIVVRVNMEMELRSFFPEDFSRQLSHVGNPFPQPIDPNPNRPSSSSSSLRSLSAGSSAPIETTFSPLQPMSSSPLIDYPCQQTMQALTQMQSNIQLPMLETENAAIISAILAVLTSSTSTLPQEARNSPYNYQLNPQDTAFERYSPTTTPARASSRPQSLLKRAILFYSMFNFMRSGGEQPVRRRPTSNQLYRVISERRRRERLNEHFNALRSLLPFGTKKDKASVLTRSREYLTSLKAQITELSRQNQFLHARLLPAATEASGSWNERLNVRHIPVFESNVRLIPVLESTSEQRIVDLRISIRGERPIEKILMRLLEFLKLDTNVSLMSMEANTQISGLGSVNHVNLRLRIEGNEWDESSFQEAVRRLVAHLAQ